jgi:hypothetical protein
VIRVAATGAEDAAVPDASFEEPALNAGSGGDGGHDSICVWKKMMVFLFDQGMTQLSSASTRLYTLKMGCIIGCCNNVVHHAPVSPRLRDLFPMTCEARGEAWRTILEVDVEYLDLPEYESLLNREYDQKLHLTPAFNRLKKTIMGEGMSDDALMEVAREFVLLRDFADFMRSTWNESGRKPDHLCNNDNMNHVAHAYERMGKRALNA